MAELVSATDRLREFFSPESIAVVGANDGNGFVKNLVRSPGSTRLHLVNRRGAPVLGYPTQTSIGQLAADVDLAVVSVPAEGVLPTLVEGVQHGIRNYIIHSAGFGESGPEGRVRQDELIAFARDNDVWFLGPNCLGFANHVRGIPLHGATVPERLLAGNVGVIAQSGSASIVVMNADRRFEFSHVVTTGNEAFCTSEDVLQFLIDDDRTEVIVMFVEALRDGRRFMELARAALAVRKPIIALKVGRSAAGRRVAMSHTGAIAGSSDVYEAALSSVGVIQVADFDELIATTNVLASVGKRLITRPAVIGISGGELGLVADIASEVGLDLPRLSENTREQLAALMGLDDAEKIANPLDFGNGYSPKTFQDSFERALTILEADELVDGLILVQDSHESLQEGYRIFYRAVTDRFSEHVAASGRPAVHISNLAERHDPLIVAPLREAGVLSMAGVRTALRAIQNCAEYALQRCTPSPVGERGAEGSTGPIRARLENFIVARQAVADMEYIPEYEAMSLLSDLDIPTVEEVTAVTPDEAVAAATKLGFPVVVKVWSDHVVHKANAGGVALGINSADEVVRAFSQVTGAVAAGHPNAANGVIVAPQKAGAVEAILGAIEDETFGTFIVVGVGGGLVEALGRTGVFAPPRTSAEAAELIEASDLAPVLRHIGVAPERLASTVLRFSQIAQASSGLLSEFEINPIIVDRSGEHWAVDARMRLL